MPIIADLLVTKGSALSTIGRPREGLGVTETGRQLAESVGLSFTVLRATLNSINPMQEDDPAACLATARRGLDLATRLGLPGFIASFAETAAFMAYRTGDWDVAAGILRDGLQTIPDEERVHLDGVLSTYAVLQGEPGAPHVARVRAMVEGVTDPNTLGHLAQVQLFWGLATGDRTPVDEAVAWIKASDPEGMDATSWTVLARICLWAGDATTATQAMEGLRSSTIRGRAVDAQAAVLAAGIAALAGRTEEALAGYRLAIRTFTDLGLRWDVAMIGLDMAVLLDPADPEVRAAAVQARELFAELGAQPFQARLDAALTGTPSRVGG